MPQTLLCPKEVANKLGVSDRTARRLMAAQIIFSFRVGPRLLRTTRATVDQYILGQCDRYRRPVQLNPVTTLRAA